MPTHVVENLDDFKEQLALAGDKLVVVDFTATWCGPCKAIGPFFHELAEKPENANVIFLKVDVDDAEEVSAACKINCMPTFKFYKNKEKEVSAACEIYGAPAFQFDENIFMVDEYSGTNKETLTEKMALHR